MEGEVHPSMPLQAYGRVAGLIRFGKLLALWYVSGTSSQPYDAGDLTSGKLTTTARPG